MPSNRLHLLYHEIRPSPSRYSYVVAQSNFGEHLDAIVRARQSGSPILWPEITFDDGHLSNYELALPALATRDLQAHFFITVGWTGTRRDYMSWTELRSLQAAGQKIGAHGWSHTLLTHCDDTALKIELQTARLTLEDKLGSTISTISLPGGRFDKRVIAACREAGYLQIYTSIPKIESQTSPGMVGRINVRNDADAQWIRRLLDPATGTLEKIARQDRYKSAMKKLLGDSTYARLWALLNRQEAANEPDEMPNG